MGSRRAAEAKRWMSSLIQTPLRFIFVAIALLLASEASVGQSRSGHGVDFRNFTYPGIWYKEPFRLTKGTVEVQHEHCVSLYTFDDVRYVNLTGGARKEALVTINDLTACGSSGVSLYFYVYSLVGNRPRLLWKFGSGADSEAGLKDFHLVGRTLVFELYGNYRLNGSKPKVVAWPHFCCPDCCPEKYTRLWVSWNGRRFVQTKRAVFPFRFKSIDDYEKTRKQ